ncbi:hypothetical protein V5799_009742 [Amblyomma americanum]|uniref:Uncharacterized protein n=1 Tax=Amblyomma americanum TaxID=6943 RepID=A0AAQ4FAT3_AMBAM
MDGPETRTIKFRHVRCNKCGELPLTGARWKCDTCHGYDLCTTCYLNGKHNPEHCFVRYDAPDSAGIRVNSKQGSQKKQREDVVAGATAEGDIARGAIFRTIYCDSCGQREILGTRWKCAACFNYDLCTACYRGGMHNIDHVFLRIDVPGGAAVKVPPRRGAVKAEGVRFQGIYCDTCEQCPIIGTRWKCALCVEYDLCTTCYLRGMHNLDHVFLRVEVPGGTADMVASRKGSGNLPVENVQFKDVIFSGINCNGCDKRGIVGARWKCDQCIDYDLCTSCYVANAHSLDHVFWRFDSPGREGLRVSPRNGLITTDGRAVLQEAVKFDGINCHRCRQRGIVGRRWKCAVCLDYDLCSACYMSDEHDQDHAFLRFDEPSAEGVRVLRREVSKNTHSRADSMGEENVCEDRRMKERERKPKDITAGDHDARDELVTKLRELQDAVQCAICMEGQRNVAFLCGHRSCADCAEHLSVCHMCRLPITMKITLY